jgi:glutamate-1-semialdehyde 2,1-aminomutase
MTSSPRLVGGISSAARALPPGDGGPPVIGRSAGPYLWDTEGRRYVDTALGYGGTVLGHAPAPVIAAVEEALRQGPLPAFAHPREEAAAVALGSRTGPLSDVVFTNSGSEAVHLACAIARAVTGRRRIAKMAAGYDGWYDQINFGTAGTKDAELATNSRPENGNVVLLRYNDQADTEQLFRDDSDIACVIVEPVLANAGCIMPAPGYLRHLQETARRHGALLIADEVLTGFRMSAGLTAHSMGLDPDLAAVGKAIGSGIAVAGVVGRPAVMAVCADGRAPRAGTYSGNPVASAAVLATMAMLESADYEALLARGAAFRVALETTLRGAGVPASTTGLGTCFTLWFSDHAPTTYAEAARAVRGDLTLLLHHAMRRHGVLTVPTLYGRYYLSFAHDAEAMTQLAAAVAASAGEVAEAASA